MIKSNYHTHSIYCDGKDTPEEMILEAIDKGFEILGFSGHSYFEPEADITMGEEKLEKYISELKFLKEKYKDKIKILIGLEQDSYSEEPNYPFDYLIGSVHVVKKNGEYISVDLSSEYSRNVIKEVYHNDFDAFAEDYFAEMETVVEKTKCDIIGHFDLITKYNDKFGIKESPRYLKAAKKAVDALLPYGIPFEINTGGMARAGKKEPYPSINILKMIKEGGGKIIFTSDCHQKKYLDHAFDYAEKLAKKLGFTKRAIITENGTEYIDL